MTKKTKRKRVRNPWMQMGEEKGRKRGRTTTRRTTKGGEKRGKDRDAVQEVARLPKLGEGVDLARARPRMREWNGEIA